MILLIFYIEEQPDREIITKKVSPFGYLRDLKLNQTMLIENFKKLELQNYS